MNKIRIVYKPDKSVAIIYPAPKSRRVREIEKSWLARVFKKTMARTDLDGLPYEDTDTSALPASREFRNAWEGEKGKAITINSVKRNNIISEKAKAEKRRLAIKALGD